MKDLLLYEKMDIQPGDFPIKLLSAKRWQCILPHWHEHYELLYFIDGECEAYVDGKKLLVKKGDLLVANGTQVHSFTSGGSVLFHSLIISPVIFKDIDLKKLELKSYISQDCNAKKYFDDIDECWKEYKNDRIGSDMKLKSLVYMLFSYLFENYSEPIETVSETHLTQLKRLYSIFNYISENYHLDISTKDLAEICFVTESYFCRFFKMFTGMTFASYITEFRIKKAQLLLEKTNGDISAIATSVGFSDANYFARTFKRVVGVSPSKYRKNR